jgi:hypothetical protein
MRTQKLILIDRLPPQPQRRGGSQTEESIQIDPSTA